MKPKDMMLIPQRLALALQAAGWYVRSDVIWHKPNCMPSSVSDRPTTAHEYIWMLTKSPRYFFDMEAIKEEVTGGTHSRGTKLRPPKEQLAAEAGHGHKDWTAKTADKVESRNKRSVWTVPTSPYSGSHFATFPHDLIKPCVLSSTSEKGCCPRCGAQWRRIVEKSGGTIGKGCHDHSTDAETGQRVNFSGGLQGEGDRNGYVVRTVGWEAGCDCGLPETANVPAIVLDPFGGTGTTAEVALTYGRHAVLIELNPDSIRLCEERLKRVLAQELLSL